MRYLAIVIAVFSLLSLFGMEFFRYHVQSENLERAEFALYKAFPALSDMDSVHTGKLYSDVERDIYIGNNYSEKKVKSNYLFFSNTLWSSFLAKKVRMMDIKNLDYSTQSEYVVVTFSGIDFKECLSLKDVDYQWQDADLVTLNGYPLMKLPSELDFKSSPCARGEYSNYITLYKQLN